MYQERRNTQSERIDGYSKRYLNENVLEVLGEELTSVTSFDPKLPKDILNQGNWRIVVRVKSQPYAFTDFAFILNNGVFQDISNVVQERSAFRDLSQKSKKNITETLKMHQIFAALNNGQQLLGWDGATAEDPPHLSVLISEIGRLSTEGVLLDKAYELFP